MLHIIHEFGGVENLKGKKIAMSWLTLHLMATSLRSSGYHRSDDSFRYGRVLAHPEGYEVFPEVEAVAAENAKKSGGSFTKTNNMAEAFKDADIVYPKSWAPFAAMEKRTNLYAEGDFEGIDKLEKNFLLRMPNTKTGLAQKNS